MMYLSNLASVVRASGLPVVEVPGWQTRGHGGIGGVRGIVCHHTGSSQDGRDYPSLAVVRDGRVGLAGPLAQLGLGRSGTVYVIAAGLAWHAGEGSWPGLLGNWDCIGIEAESSGLAPVDWTQPQLDAYPRLCAALARGYSIDPSKIIGHKEWAPGRKIDPYAIDMGDFRNKVREILQGSGEDSMSAADVASLKAHIDARLGVGSVPGDPKNIKQDTNWIKNTLFQDKKGIAFVVDGGPIPGALFAFVDGVLVHIPTASSKGVLQRLGLLDKRSDTIQKLTLEEWTELVNVLTNAGVRFACSVADGCAVHVVALAQQQP